MTRGRLCFSRNAIAMAAAAAALLLSTLGCGDDGRRGGRGSGDDGGSGGDASPGDGSFPDRSVPPSDGSASGTCSKMDILFVIDDSGSMSEEQTNLANNFPMFVDVLDEFTTEDGSPIDYRLGVTTTGRDGTYIVTISGFPPIEENMDGDNGALRQQCGMPRPWIERADPDVSGTFSCEAQVGTSGPSVEMPLLMTEWAVTVRIEDGTNAGFLREDALLAVVMLTDENDCSRTDDPIEEEISGDISAGAAMDQCDPTNPALVPVGDSIAALDAVKGDRGRWATAVIAGPGPGTCSSSFGEAQEATRLKELVDMAGDNAVFSSICEGDLASALTRALETFDAACQSFPPLI